MKFPKPWLLPLALAVAIFSFPRVRVTAHATTSHPKTIKAVSCNTSNVQHAMNQAHDGDTVEIPAGTCTWKTGFRYTVPGTLTIHGSGSETVVGGGDATVLIDDINRTQSDSGMMVITTVAGKPFRLTGITLQSSGNSYAKASNGSIRIRGYSQQVRIDHVHFNMDHLVVKFSDWIYGVVDHCLADHKHNVINVSHAKWNNHDWGDGSWADSPHFGTNQFIFIEDSVFNGGASYSEGHGPDDHGSYANDCDTGGRIVLRHNTFNYAGVMGHEMEKRKRSCRVMEVYQNTFNASPTLTLAFGTFIRSGTALIWGNTYTGYTTVVRSVTDRANANNGNWGNGYPLRNWGFCGRCSTPEVGSVNNSGTAVARKSGLNFSSTWTKFPIEINGGYLVLSVSSPRALTLTASGGAQTAVSYSRGSDWDGNTDATGYPCLDQIGRGRGDLLANPFPNVINSVTGKISWPNQTQEPVYLWGNIYNPPSSNRSHHYWSNASQVTQENRDYYLQLPNHDAPTTSFNGTAGVGQGPLAVRPLTCTPLVAYWATDTNTLYQCSVRNTWTVYYVPYTYPHPLQGASSSPPTNQKVTGVHQ